MLLSDEDVAALRADLERVQRNRKPRKLNCIEYSGKRQLVTRKIGNMG